VTHPTKAMEHSLAERLGMTVRQLRREMGTDELAEWVGYDRYVHDLREAEIARLKNERGS